MKNPVFQLRIGLFILLLGFAGGVLFGMNILSWICLLFGIFGYLFSNRRSCLVWICVLLVSFLYGSLFSEEGESLLEFEKSEYLFGGSIDSFPEYKIESVRSFFRLNWVGDKSSCWKASERILIRFNEDVQIDYGDVIWFAGTAKKPRSFDNFNYPAYLERFGVFWIVRQEATEIHVLSQKNGFFLKQFAYHLRVSAINILYTYFDVGYRDIVAGVSIGLKKQLPDTVDRLFRDSGLTHVLVVSGYNVAVLLAFVFIVFRSFGRVLVLCISLLFLLLFLFITGGDPPVLRAVFMGGIALWGTIFGRKRDTKNILLFSVFCMAVFQPRLLVYDISFQLSLAATAGIVTFGRLFQQWFGGSRFGEIVSILLAAQISVLPVILWYFGVFPWGGILANVLAESLIPLILLGSMLVLGFHFTIPFVASFLSVLVSYIVLGLFWVARIGAWLPVATASSFFAKFVGIVISVWFVYMFFQEDLKKVD